MNSSNDTIYALSSGGLPSGVAIIRMSGNESFHLMDKICSKVDIPERIATYTEFVDPFNNMIIDRGLVFSFKNPKSFTGEDCVEFHFHGGRAVVEKFLSALEGFDNCRIADPGEFSRRAFENGKLDLTEIEGLADLIRSETETQRKQAVSQSAGSLRLVLDAWRSIIIYCRAFMEAELDFADEDDVGDDASERVIGKLRDLAKEIGVFLDDGNQGEIVREGFRVALMGPPNAGKSSLLNALAKRDVAIVSDEAGTTRDVVEAHLDISGYKVSAFDTAGIRDTESIVEAEGIRRAKNVASNAHLVFWLSPEGKLSEDAPEGAVCLQTKLDITDEKISDLGCSVNSDNGLDALLYFLEEKLRLDFGVGEPGIITRKRQRVEIANCLDHLNACISDNSKEISLKAEDLRLAGDCLGRVTGRIDVEDLLDVIFSEFCVGK